MQFVFDTNTLVSALLFENSVPAQAFFTARRIGEILISDALVAEISEVLHRKVGYPTEMLRSPHLDFPILDKIDQFIRVKFIQGNLVDELEPMQHPCDFTLEFGRLPSLGCLSHRGKEELMIPLY